MSAAILAAISAPRNERASQSTGYAMKRSSVYLLRLVYEKYLDSFEIRRILNEGLVLTKKAATYAGFRACFARLLPLTLFVQIAEI